MAVKAASHGNIRAVMSEPCGIGKVDQRRGVPDSRRAAGNAVVLFHFSRG
jgi:hypothetical protein